MRGPPLAASLLAVRELGARRGAQLERGGELAEAMTRAADDVPGGVQADRTRRR